MSSEALLNEVRLLRRDLADLSSRVLALEDLAARQSEELAARSPSAVTSYTAVTSVRTGSPGLPSPAASDGLDLLLRQRGPLLPISLTLRGVLLLWRWGSFFLGLWLVSIVGPLGAASSLWHPGSTCWLGTSIW